MPKMPSTAKKMKKIELALLYLYIGYTATFEISCSAALRSMHLFGPNSHHLSRTAHRTIAKYPHNSSRKLTTNMAINVFRKSFALEPRFWLASYLSLNRSSIKMAACANTEKSKKNTLLALTHAAANTLIDAFNSGILCIICQIASAFKYQCNYESLQSEHS